MCNVHQLHIFRDDKLLLSKRSLTIVRATITVYPIGRPVRATITLYPIGRPVRATITLYPIGRPVRATITLYLIGRPIRATIILYHIGRLASVYSRVTILGGNKQIQRVNVCN